MGAGAAHALSLASPDVAEGGRIAEEQVFNGGDCRGQDVSPALAWSGAPGGTKSFAVSMFDPDAAGFWRRAENFVIGLIDSDRSDRSGFWHWWVVDISSETASLPKGAGKGPGLPAGAVQLRNDFGAIGYDGPCPPKGRPHHYQITVYALDVDKLDVDENTPPALVGSKVRPHVLAKATLVGLWGR
ncbi:MAG: YbhB/YbcL family Raf kinase inhibitor-like protein [Hyphomicrobiales bacterium]|nr:YbhB/YbcL family Raf kinase inhibitor-like protein [Hyphomicrobiales bacterium]